MKKGNSEISNRKISNRKRKHCEDTNYKNCLVHSGALYSAEIRMLTQADRSRLAAFEMWIWIRMEKIN